MSLKIVIAGSRTITDYNHLLTAISQAVKEQTITPAVSFELVSGGAIGVDTLARRFANENNLILTEMKPIYNGPNDRGAPLRRNCDMAEYGDVLVAVWDGVSPGTKHMINEMKKRGKPIHVYKVNK